MAYLGVQPLKGQNRTIDNISAGFNGSNVTFNLTSNGFALTPATAYQLFISLNGVIRSPGVDFTVNGNQITFTTAPAAGLSFWGLYQGDAIDSVSVSDGSITTAKLATGLTVTLGAGTVSVPSLTFSGDTNTGIYAPGADQIALSTGGVQRFTVNSSGQIITTGSFVDPAITGTILEDIFTITDGAAFEIDPGNGSIQLITLGASRTPKATNFAAGEAVTLMVDDGSAYTLTWTDSTFGGSGVVWKTGSGSAPTLNTTGYTVIVLWKVGSQVYGARVGDA